MPAPPDTTKAMPPLRLLMLHGYTQSGHLFRAKTRALEKNLTKHLCPHPFSAVDLIYPTGPVNVRPADIPGFSPEKFEADDGTGEVDAWAWWQMKQRAEGVVYEGLEASLARVGMVLREQGPFDGVVGFSQGACFAGIVASLLEEGRVKAFKEAEREGGMPYPGSFLKEGSAEDRVHGPLRFAVSYSGFVARNQTPYRALYEPKISTPMLHFIGSLDTVVEEGRSLALVDATEAGTGDERSPRLVYHPGGHFVPSSQAQPVGALVAFIRDVFASREDETEEEKVEDMDVPF